MRQAVCQLLPIAKKVVCSESGCSRERQKAKFWELPKDASEFVFKHRQLAVQQTSNAGIFLPKRSG